MLGQLVPVAVDLFLPVRMQRALDVGAQEAGDHDRRAHADQLGEWGAQGQGLEDAVFRAKPPAKERSTTLYPWRPGCWHIRRPWSAAGSRARPSSASCSRGSCRCRRRSRRWSAGRVRLGGELDGHGQLFHAVGAGLQGDAFEADLAQVVHALHEILAHPFRNRGWCRPGGCGGRRI
jgi:hypothetical protein